MDENLLKLLELVEKDKVLFQLLRQCPYEILRNFKVRKYKDSRFVLKQGEIYNTFYIVASGYADMQLHHSCEDGGKLEHFDVEGRNSWNSV